jgi:hypothetical protein
MGGAMEAIRGVFVMHEVGTYPPLPLGKEEGF